MPERDTFLFHGSAVAVDGAVYIITAPSGTESLLVPTGGAAWSGLVKGNRTLGVILSLLKEETTEAAVVADMKSPVRRAGGSDRPGRAEGAGGAAQNRSAGGVRPIHIPEVQILALKQTGSKRTESV